MTEPVEVLEVEGLKVSIWHDDQVMDVEDIVEGSDIKICSFDPRSTISNLNEFDSVQDIMSFCREKGFTPLLMHKYEHGMVMFRAGEVGDRMGYPFNDPWDAGAVGMVLVPDGYEDKLKSANALLSDITDWCNGSIYGYIVEDKDGEEIDSCWGFIGTEAVESEARASAKIIANTLPKQMEMTV